MKLSKMDIGAAGLAELTGETEADVARELAKREVVQQFARLITQMREAEGMTQSDLGACLGLSGAARVSQYESGQLRHAVNLKTFAAIAHELGYDIDVSVRRRDNAPRRESRSPEDFDGPRLFGNGDAV